MGTLIGDLEGILVQLFPRVNIDISWHGAIILEKIIVATAERNQGIGTEVMNYICEFADNQKVSIVLTPDGTFGGDVDRLREFYSRFNFMDRDDRTMIRFPKG